MVGELERHPFKGHKPFFFLPLFSSCGGWQLMWPEWPLMVTPIVRITIGLLWCQGSQNLEPRGSTTPPQLPQAASTPKHKMPKMPILPIALLTFLINDLLRYMFHISSITPFLNCNSGVAILPYFAIFSIFHWFSSARRHP